MCVTSFRWQGRVKKQYYNRVVTHTNGNLINFIPYQVDDLNVMISFGYFVVVLMTILCSNTWKWADFARKLLNTIEMKHFSLEQLCITRTHSFLVWKLTAYKLFLVLQTRCHPYNLLHRKWKSSATHMHIVAFCFYAAILLFWSLSK